MLLCTPTRSSVTCPGHDASLRVVHIALLFLPLLLPLVTIPSFLLLRGGPHIPAASRDPPPRGDDLGAEVAGLPSPAAAAPLSVLLLAVLIRGLWSPYLREGFLYWAPGGDGWRAGGVLFARLVWSVVQLSGRKVRRARPGYCLWFLVFFLVFFVVVVSVITSSLWLNNIKAGWFFPGEKIVLIARRILFGCMSDISTASRP